MLASYHYTIIYFQILCMNAVFAPRDIQTKAVFTYQVPLKPVPLTTMATPPCTFLQRLYGRTKAAHPPNKARNLYLRYIIQETKQPLYHARCPIPSHAPGKERL